MQVQGFQGGNLQEALSRLKDQIRSDPAESKHRIYYFQLLVILGQWDQALSQLKVLEELDSSTSSMAVAYRAAISCEALRADIFAGKRSPIIFGQPEEWTALLLESLRLTGEQQYAQAEELRSQAFDKAPTSSGSLNGEAFEWIADADSRMGPMFEVILDGRYTWVPFHRVSRIEIEDPCDLRDLVWMPGHFTWANGGELVGLMPTRYPSTESSEDDQLLLSRKTDWIEHGTDTFFGRGQRIFATDAGEYALMDIRKIELDSQSNGANESGDGESSDG